MDRRRQRLDNMFKHISDQMSDLDVDHASSFNTIIRSVPYHKCVDPIRGCLNGGDIILGFYARKDPLKFNVLVGSDVSVRIHLESGQFVYALDDKYPLCKFMLIYTSVHLQELEGDLLDGLEVFYVYLTSEERKDFIMNTRAVFTVLPHYNYVNACGMMFLINSPMIHGVYDEYFRPKVDEDYFLPAFPSYYLNCTRRFQRLSSERTALLAEDLLAATMHPDRFLSHLSSEIEAAWTLPASQPFLSLKEKRNVMHLDHGVIMVETALECVEEHPRGDYEMVVFTEDDPELGVVLFDGSRIVSKKGRVVLFIHGTCRSTLATRRVRFF
jgi:hypothetical protein